LNTKLISVLLKTLLMFQCRAQTHEYQLKKGGRERHSVCVS